MADSVHPNIVVETFDPDTMLWKRWHQQCEGAFLIMNITKDKEKVPYLLHYLGQKVFAKLCDYMDDEDVYKKDYSVLVKKLKELYEPKVIEIAECFKFQCRKQQKNESVQDFLTEIKKLAQSCGFGEFLDTALRNQFVYGLENTLIRQRLLEMKDLKLSTAVTTAMSMELCRKENSGMFENKSENSINEVSEKKRFSNSKFGEKSRFQSSYKNRNSSRGGVTKRPVRKRGRGEILCFRCGKKDHVATECTLDRDIVCRACGVKGHIQKVCFKAGNNFQNNSI